MIVNVRMLALVAFIIVLTKNPSKSASCNEKESCVNLDLSLNYSSQNNYFSCSGDRSCMKAQKISIQGGRLDCSGSYSCYDTKYMYYTTNTPGYSTRMECSGLHSCSNINHAVYKNVSLLCHGSLSCFNNSIQQSSLFVSCAGYKSCSNSKWMVTNSSDSDSYTYDFSGYASASNTNFYVDKFLSRHEISFFFRGSDSAYNSTIFAQDDTDDNKAKIKIYCYGNACNKLTLMCDTSGVYNVNNDNSNSCYFTTIYCDIVGQSAVCPSDNLDFTYLFDNKLLNLSLLNTNLNLAGQSASARIFNLYDNVTSEYDPFTIKNKNCGSEGECQSDNIGITSNITNNIHSLTCTAAGTCWDSNISISHQATSPIVHGSLVSIRCDGYVLMLHLLYVLCNTMHKNLVDFAILYV